MTLLMLLEMVASAFGDRLGIGTRGPGAHLSAAPRACRGRVPQVLRRRGARHLAFVASSERGLPGRALRQRMGWRALPPAQLPPRCRAARLAAGRPRRRAGDRRRGPAIARRLPRSRCSPSTSGPAITAVPAEMVEPPSADGDDIAVLLYTSGTTAAPKAVVLRHRHLSSYVIGSVEFAVGRRRRRHARERAAVPHRRCGHDPLQPLLGPAARLPPGLHPRGLARHRAGGGHHARHGRPHHAGSGGRPTSETDRPPPPPRCARWPTAAPACRSGCWRRR